MYKRSNTYTNEEARLTLLYSDLGTYCCACLSYRNLVVTSLPQSQPQASTELLHQAFDESLMAAPEKPPGRRARDWIFSNPFADLLGFDDDLPELSTDETSEASSEEDYDVFDEEPCRYDSEVLPAPSFVDTVAQRTAELIHEEAPEVSFITQINFLKFVHEETSRSCLQGLVKGIVATMHRSPDQHLKKWCGLLDSYMMAEADQHFVLAELESHLLAKKLHNWFPNLVAVCFEAELVDGDAILTWDEQSRSLELKELMSSFVDWLLQDDEDPE